MPGRFERLAQEESPQAVKLRASPNFALCFSLDGRPFVAKETEPYTHYWLSERERLLLAMFSKRGGVTVAEAIDGYLRLSPAQPAERRKLTKAIAELRAAEVLIGTRDDTSRYTEEIVESYLAFRPFPTDLARLIVAQGKIDAGSHVLELAGGPGDLAIKLAGVSRHVTLMDLSKAFLRSAAARAKRLDRSLVIIHDSCNRLSHREEQYDTVVVSQALHWLDDVQVCRGVCRCLRAGGSFFVVQSAFDVDSSHPLGHLLGTQSVLGPKSTVPFVTQLESLGRRLSLLFEAFATPHVQRVDLAHARTFVDPESPSPVALDRMAVFRQRRPMGVGFARAFFTASHIKATGQSTGEFWRDVESRCKGRPTETLMGTFDWGILQFQRGGGHRKRSVRVPRRVSDIGYDGK